ncbi:hypothetical protein D6D21_09305 [Aureobasidium pullulans]|uniref:Uncharacterized protein n=1 Tax=Aureobasidium pullulans TaxID=5580 RepID=A0AB74IMF1_AURPU|nr:hypothetical protein D6D21_09305 [Aureobasidium pullulans]
MDDDNTGRRIADFRRSLLNYEEMAAQNRTSENRSSDPDSGYRSSTPEPSAFIADPNSPHLPHSPALHPNITTRARNRTHRRFSDLFSLRGRTPTFDERPKISRPIVNQGDIDVPHNGPYIYNHPSRPRLDVEIPRSSFSDLWGQRYGPVGDDGYNIDARPSPRVTRSMDFDLLVEPRETQSAMARGSDNLALGRIRDWYAAGMPDFVAPADADESPADSDVDNDEHEDGVEAEGEDEMSYLMPLVSPSPESSASSTTTSASLPSISDLLARPRSDFIRRDQESRPFLRPSVLVPEEEDFEDSAPLVSELSERWIRHPLRQNPPNAPSPVPPVPSAPPPSPVTPSQPPTPVDTWSHLHGFQPHCGVTITSVGDDEGAVVENFTLESYPADLRAGRAVGVNAGVRDRQPVSSVEAVDAEDLIVTSPSARARSRAQSTPPARPQSTTPSRQRRQSGAAGITPVAGPALPARRPVPTAPITAPTSTIKSFCCGLFGNNKKKQMPSRPNISTPTPIIPPPLVTPIPAAHTTIFEEDEDQDDLEIEPATQYPPRIVVEQEQEVEDNHVGSGIIDEGVRRRQSVRHSWVTVSRWLE